MGYDEKCNVKKFKRFPYSLRKKTHKITLRCFLFTNWKLDYFNKKIASKCFFFGILLL